MRKEQVHSKKHRDGRSKEDWVLAIDFETH
jgi:hypothetical protein